jgi:hypothetical protein
VFEQAVALVSRPFGDDLDPPVEQVRRRAGKPELEGAGAHPPAETHALYMSTYPRGQPDQIILHVVRS